MNFQYNYNLSGSGRKPLVEAISQILDLPAIYQGAPGFSYTVGDYTVNRNGVLSCGDNIHLEIMETLIEALRERGFVAENADNASDAATATENTLEADSSTTVAETPSEADEASENNVTTADTEENNTATDSAATGSALSDILTIEIPDTGFTSGAKENLRKIVASKKTVLEKALGADGLPVIEKDGKLIFPWFTLHGIDGEADAYSRLIAAICKMAKEQKRVTAKDEPAENEKYKMRLFLIRLGFIGDEYKAARKILLRNLTGNSSWKSGHKPERETDAIIPPNPAEAAPATEQELAAPLEEMDTAEDELQKAAEGGETYGK